MTHPFTDAIIIDTVQHQNLIPQGVMAEIREMWVDYGYGNDNYYHSVGWELKDYRAAKKDGEPAAEEFCYPLLLQWLDETFHPALVEGDPNILIHLWW
jgi:hypothetical protein